MVIWVKYILQLHEVIKSHIKSIEMMSSHVKLFKAM